MIIYMATNTLNNKKYIGQTVQTLDKRKSRHLRDAKKRSNLPFRRAIKKYGADGFGWKILYYGKSIEDLNAMEEYYIAAYETRVPRGYNVMLGGGNRRIPLAVREKMSQAHKGEKNHNFGKKFSAEHLANMSKVRVGEKNHNFGKKHSAEQRVKMSEALKGDKNPMFGKRHSTEARSNMSKARAGDKNHMFGKKHSAETREKIRTKAIGRKHSVETRAKLSALSRGERNPRFGKTGGENPNFDPRIYAFFHPEYGIVGDTKSSLNKKFILGVGRISGVVSGRRNSYKGWRMAANM